MVVGAHTRIPNSLWLRNSFSHYGRCGVDLIGAEETKVVLAKKLHADKSLEIDDICKTLRMSRSTFYRYVRL